MSTNSPLDSSATPESAGPATPRTRPLFPLGQIVATPGVLEHFDRYEINAQLFIERHQCGDWGCVGPEDAQENDLSVEHGFRVLSAYDIAGERVWIITEADRSSTCILFPSEY